MSALAAVGSSSPVYSPPPVSPVRGVARSTSFSNSGELTLKTKDGDTVSLSFSTSKTKTTAAATNGDSSVVSSEKSSSLEINVEINGSLDKKEMSDIMRLLKKIGNFLRGGGNDVEKAAKLQPKPSSSIAAFDFSYQQTKSVETAGLNVFA
jgi:hypothetical protein